jgi:hypothetical protein
MKDEIDIISSGFSEIISEDIEEPTECKKCKKVLPIGSPVFFICFADKQLRHYDNFIIFCSTKCAKEKILE